MSADRERCTVANCDRPQKGRQAYCAAHIERIRAGKPLDRPIQYRGEGAFELLFTKSDGCWEWRGNRSPEGYGRFSHQYAHRLSYERYVGPIPDGLHIDHLCRNRACINPEHLEPVTHRENVRRGMSPGAIRWRERQAAS